MFTAKILTQFPHRSNYDVTSEGCLVHVHEVQSGVLIRVRIACASAVTSHQLTAVGCPPRIDRSVQHPRGKDENFKTRVPLLKEKPLEYSHMEPVHLKANDLRSPLHVCWKDDADGS